MKRPLMLISGANSQVGSYLARHYARQNQPLLLFYYQRNERIKDLGASMRQLDLTDFEAVASAVKSAPAPIGSLIHCAAVRSYDAQPLADPQPETFPKIFDSNFYAAYNILKCTLAPMREAGYGRVIMFGSDVSKSGLPNGSAYAAAKAAIANLAKSAAIENVRRGILINVISPGPVDTALAEDFSGSYLQFRENYFQNYIQNSISGALISKEEILDTVEYLLSPNLKNFFGQEIYLSGGKS